ncbi:MAG: hypothetical protein WBW53_22180 [Terriglobales bacterium]
MNFPRISIAVFVFITFMAANSFAATCTNATLNGVYGMVGSGLNGSGQPAASVTQVTADGNGNLTGTTMKSIDGTIVTFTTTGTYQLAKNCTGSATLTNQDDETESSNIFMNNTNKGAFLIQTDANHVVSSIAYEQGKAPCTNLGVHHTYSLEATGILLSSGQIAAAGQLVLNGKGSLTGTVTFSVNGSISSLPVTGTYSINSNCTGTATFTPQGQSAVNLGVVIVNAGKEMMFIETDANTIVSGTLQE